MLPYKCDIYEFIHNIYIITYLSISNGDWYKNTKIIVISIIKEIEQTAFILLVLSIFLLTASNEENLIIIIIATLQIRDRCKMTKAT